MGISKRTLALWIFTEATLVAVAGTAIGAVSTPLASAVAVGTEVSVGFVALAYEVLLTRLSILYLGNSVSVFPLVLTAFLEALNRNQRPQLAPRPAIAPSAASRSAFSAGT